MASELPCGHTYPTGKRCKAPESVHRGEHPFQPWDRRSGEDRRVERRTPCPVCGGRYAARDYHPGEGHYVAEFALPPLRYDTPTLATGGGMRRHRPEVRHGK